MFELCRWFDLWYLSATLLVLSATVFCSSMLKLTFECRWWHADCITVYLQASHSQHFSGDPAKATALQSMMKLVYFAYQLFRQPDSSREVLYFTVKFFLPSILLCIQLVDRSPVKRYISCWVLCMAQKIHPDFAHPSPFLVVFVFCHFCI